MAINKGGIFLNTLTVEQNRQDKIISDFEKRRIKREALTTAIIVLQEEFDFTFNDLNRFRRKLKDLERG